VTFVQNRPPVSVPHGFDMIRFAFYVNDFLSEFRLSGITVEQIGACTLILPFDFICIQDINGSIGQAPRHPVIEADYNGGHTWYRNAMGVEIGAVNLEFIPNIGEGQSEMWIVGQYGN